MKVAIIPARGGSQRIPRKNLREFAGKPMIAYSIEAALQSGLFASVVVSTDDSEIAEVSKSLGAEVPFLRPARLADAHTGTQPVVKHAVDWLLAHGMDVSIVCCIYATAPLLTYQYLADGLFRLQANDQVDYAFSVTTFPFPIFRAIRKTPSGGVAPFFPEHIAARSQDLEEAYHDAGQFYWGRTEAFLNDRPIFSENSLPVILPRYLVQDIDTPEDWVQAEFMFKAMQSTFRD